MPSIDEKVVRITFDNRDFEKNAKETEKTLGSVDEKLKFKNASKGFKDVEKAADNVKMSGLIITLQNVQKSFSAMEAAAFSTINNIVNKAVDAGIKLTKSLSVDQITEGYTKYEQKVTSVATIMNATGKSIDEVSDALQKLNWFSDETSYSFSEMVNNVGKFTSSGVELDRAIEAVQGTATLAAISGQNSESAARVMYNFAQALGSAVRAEDWSSVETANMATEEFKETIIEAALAEGDLVQNTEGFATTLKGTVVNAKTFRQTLEEGWFSSETLIRALNRYGSYAGEVYEITQEKGILASEAMELMGEQIDDLGERAFKAAQESKTFADSINATKDAVSTGWMKTFEELFGNYEESKEVWSELTEYLWDIFAASGEARNELLHTAFSSGWELLIEQLDTAELSIEEFESNLADLAEKNGRDVEALINEYGSLDAAVQGGEFNDLMPYLFDAYNQAVDKAINQSSEIQGIFSQLESTLTGIDLNSTDEEIQKVTDRLIEMGYSAQDAYFIVDDFQKNQTVSIDDLTDAQLASIGFTKRQIKVFRKLSSESKKADSELSGLINSVGELSTREIFIDSFRNVLDGLTSVIESLKDAWNEVFPEWSVDTIKDLVKKFNQFTEILKPSEKRLSEIKSVAKGLFAILDIGQQIVTALFQNGFNILSTVLKTFNIDIGASAANVGEAIYAFDQWLKEGNKISTVIEKLTRAVMIFVGAIISIVDAIRKLPIVQESFEKVSEAVSALTDGFGDLIDNCQTVDGFDFSKFISNFKNVKNEFVNTFSPKGSVNEETVGFVQRFKENLTLMINSFKETISQINPLSVVLIGFGLSVMMLTRKLMGALNGIINALRPISSAVSLFFGALSDNIKTLGKAAKRFLDASAFAEFAQGLIFFSLAVGILAGSLYLLSKIDVNTDNFVAIGGIFVAILGAMTLVAVFVRKNRQILKHLSYLLVSVGVAALALATAAEKIQEVDIKALASAVFIVLDFIGAIWLLSATTKNMDTKKIDGIAIAFEILALAAAFAVVAHSLSALNAFDTEMWGAKIISVTVAIAALAGAVALIGKFGGIGSLFASAGIITFAIGLVAVVKILKLLIDQDLDFMKDHLGAILVILGIVVALAALTKKVGLTLLGMGIMFVGIGVSIRIMQSTFEKLTELGAAIKPAVIAIGAIIFIFGLIAKMVTANDKGQYAARAGLMILEMSVAVAGLSLVIWGLSLLDPKDMLPAAGAIAALIGVMGWVIYAARRSQKAYGSIIALNVTLGVLAVTLAILSNFVDPKQYIAIAAGTSLLFLAFGVAFSKISGNDAFKKGVLKNLWVLAGMATVLGVLLMDISGVTVPGNFQQRLDNLIFAVGSAAAVMYILSDFVNKTKDAKTLEKGVLSNLWVLAGMITVIGTFFMFITAIPITTDAWTRLKNLAIMLTSIWGVMNILVNSMNKLKDVKALEDGVFTDLVSLSVLMTGISFLFMFITAIPFSKFKDSAPWYERLLNLAIMLTSIWGVMNILVNSMNKLKDVKALEDGVFTDLVSLSVLMTVIGTFFMFITAIPITTDAWTRLKNLVASLVGAWAAMNILASFVKKIQDIDDLGKLEDGVLKDLTVLSLIIAGLSAVFAGLTAIPTKAKWSATIATISGAAVAMLAIAKVMDNLQDIDALNDGVLKNLLALAGVLAGLTLIFSLLALIPTKAKWSATIATISGAAVAMLAIAGVMKILQTVPAISKDTIINFAILAGVISVLSIVLGAISHLADINFGEIMGIVLGVSLFAVVIGGLVTVISALNFNIASIKSILMFCTGLLIISAALPIALLAFTAMMLFVVDVTAAMVEGYGDVKENLAMIGDLIGTFIGSIKSAILNAQLNGLEDKGKQLATFAEYALPFFEMITSIDWTSIDALKNLMSVVEIFSNLVINLENFEAVSNSMYVFAEGASRFVRALKTVTEDRVAAAEAGCTKLIDFLNKLNTLMPEIDLTHWPDEDFFTYLETGLSSFALTMVAFGKTLKGFPTDSGSKVQYIGLTAKYLAEALMTVPKLSKKELKDANGLGNYGHIIQGMSEMADAFVDFTTTLQNVNISQMDKVTDLMSTMVTLQGSVSVKTLKNVEKLMKQMNDIGDEIYDFNLVTMYVDWDKMTKAKDWMLALQEIGAKTGDAFNNGFQDSMEIDSPSKIMDENGDFIIQGLVQGVENGLSKVLDLGSTTGESFMEGFDDYMGIASPAKTPAEAVVWVIEGFKKGFDEGMKRLKEIGAQYGQAFLDSVGLGPGGDLLTKLTGGVDNLKGELTGSLSSLGISTDGITSMFGDIVNSANGLNNIDLGGFKTEIASLQNKDGTFNQMLSDAAISDYDNLFEKYKNRLINKTKFEEESAKITERYIKRQNDAYTAGVNVYNQKIQELKTKIAYHQNLVNAATDDSTESYKQNQKALEFYEDALEDCTEKLNEYKKSAAEASVALNIDKHSKEVWTDYITEGIEQINETFKNTISDIDSQRIDMLDNWKKDYGESFTFTTNKDVYDQKVSDYNKRIDAMNDKLEEAKELYGEDSYQVRRYQDAVDGLTKSLKSYQDWYKKEEFDDNEIVGIKMGDNIKKETQKIKRYTANMKKLRKEGKISEEFAKYIASQDPEKALALSEWALNEASAQELKEVDDTYVDYLASLHESGLATFDKMTVDAIEGYNMSMFAFFNSLPPSVQKIAAEVIGKMTNSFDEETEKALIKYETNGYNIMTALKKGLNIEDLSIVAQDAGLKLVDGVTNMAPIIEDYQYTAGKTAGESYADGVAAGIEAGKEEVDNKKKSLFDGLLDFSGTSGTPTTLAGSILGMAAKNTSLKADEKAVNYATNKMVEAINDAVINYGASHFQVNTGWAAKNAGMIQTSLSYLVPRDRNDLSKGYERETVVYNITQNNNSPKELTRSEIAKRNRDIVSTANAIR